jgi:hypothetical protein
VFLDRADSIGNEGEECREKTNRVNCLEATTHSSSSMRFGEAEGYIFPGIFDELVLCVREIACALLGEIYVKGRGKGRAGID